MAKPTAAPYGSWKSPITPELIVAEAVEFAPPIMVDRDDVYWIEMRPAEAGRYVIVKRSRDGQTTDATPKPFNARTRVHEYGGGSYIVTNGTVYFSNFDDQRVYKQNPGTDPIPITPAVNRRYADFVFDADRRRLVCVREDHTVNGAQAVAALVGLDPNGNDAGQVLVSGNDFYSSPRISPDGSRLAWLTWNHPNMPWDGTELWVADFREDGTVGRTKLVAGGVSESIFQPEWSSDGVLHFVSDRSGWWNIYRSREDRSPDRIEPLCEMPAEFGMPQWLFGLSTYGFESAERIICIYIKQGTRNLASLSTSNGRLEPIRTPYLGFRNIRVAPGRALFFADSPTEPTAIVEIQLGGGKLEILRQSSKTSVDPGYLSAPKVIEFPTENGLTAFGFFYPPTNRDFTGPSDSKPPLLVISHGGPTGSASIALQLQLIQYWTSRGFAVVDVNYGGSTGYGREYRERLKGNWGVVDVDDCVNGAKHLVKSGRVDGERLIIRGGSAGGYTTLAALTFRNVFKAGASYFGIGDLETFVKDTHKFESRYLHSLVGPFPEKRDLYVQRSPIRFINQLSCPIIFFQGLEDKIVPPNQAVTMFEAVRSKGLPTAYLPFEGEQHGFRKADTIKRALQAELYFYSKIFHFKLPEQVQPVHIENMQSS